MFIWFLYLKLIDFNNVIPIFLHIFFVHFLLGQLWLCFHEILTIILYIFVIYEECKFKFNFEKKYFHTSLNESVQLNSEVPFLDKQFVRTLISFIDIVETKFFVYFIKILKVLIEGMTLEICLKGKINPSLSQRIWEFIIPKIFTHSMKYPFMADKVQEMDITLA